MPGNSNAGSAMRAPPGLAAQKLAAAVAVAIGPTNKVIIDKQTAVMNRRARPRR
jgi:hypothetical protein